MEPVVRVSVTVTFLRMDRSPAEMAPALPPGWQVVRAEAPIRRASRARVQKAPARNTEVRKTSVTSSKVPPRKASASKTPVTVARAR